jgi:hypothetical protein
VYRRDMSQNARTYAYIGRFLETLPRDATACAAPPFTWILRPGDASTCAHLKARWPDGVLEEHRTRGRELVFESFTVPGGSPASRGR